MKFLSILTNYTCSFVFISFASLKILYYDYVEVLVFKSELFQEAYVNTVIIAISVVEIIFSFLFLSTKSLLVRILAMLIPFAYIGYIYGVISGCGCGLVFNTENGGGNIELVVNLGLVLLIFISIYANKKRFKII